MVAEIRRRAPALMLLALAGCVGELRELPDPDAAAPIPDGAAPSPDLVGVPVARFAPTIARDLDVLHCSDANTCHGGGSAPMRLIPSPISPAELRANYGEVLPRAGAGAASSLLRKPLKGSGVPHAGTVPFASTMDPVYQRWLAWVQAGAPSGLDPADAGVDGSQ